MTLGIYTIMVLSFKLMRMEANLFTKSLKNITFTSTCITSSPFTNKSYLFYIPDTYGAQ